MRISILIFVIVCSYDVSAIVSFVTLRFSLSEVVKKHFPWRTLSTLDMLNKKREIANVFSAYIVKNSGFTGVPERPFHSITDDACQKELAC